MASFCMTDDRRRRYHVAGGYDESLLLNEHDPVSLNSNPGEQRDQTDAERGGL